MALDTVIGLKMTTGPAAEPVTTAEAKTHLRIDHSDEDTYIGTLIIAARQWVEHFTRRALIAQTWELSFDVWPPRVFALPLPPLASVTHIKFYDADNAATTVASGDYQVDTSREPGRVLLKDTATWPVVNLRPAAGVVVTYVAGWANAGAVPQAIKQATLLMVGHYYENREAVTQPPGAIVEVPQGARMLLWPYRAMEF